VPLRLVVGKLCGIANGRLDSVLIATDACCDRKCTALGRDFDGRCADDARVSIRRLDELKIAKSAENARHPETTHPA